MRTNSLHSAIMSGNTDDHLARAREMAEAMMDLYASRSISAAGVDYGRTVDDHGEIIREMIRREAGRYVDCPTCGGHGGSEWRCEEMCLGGQVRRERASELLRGQSERLKALVVARPYAAAAGDELA